MKLLQYLIVLILSIARSTYADNDTPNLRAQQDGVPQQHTDKERVLKPGEDNNIPPHLRTDEPTLDPTLSPSTLEPTLAPTTASPILFTAKGSIDEIVPTCPTTLTNYIEISDDATFHYALIPSTASTTSTSNGILCGRLSVRNNNGGWVGFAISQEGGSMVGSNAIIGVPNDILTNSINSVLKYDMSGRIVGYEVGGWGVYPMADTRQTLRDTSLTEEVNDDGEEVTVMTFTKLLVEDDENNILENGKNTFLFARGIGQSELGPHTGFGISFVKDFSEDTDVSLKLLLNVAQSICKNHMCSNHLFCSIHLCLQSPTVAPTTKEPSLAPTGLTERFFCTEDVAPLKKEYCDKWFSEGYTTLDACDSKCRVGKKSCVSTFCLTDAPTLSPTMSSVPSTMKPTVEPTLSPETPVPTTSPTLSPTVDGLAFIPKATDKPTETKFSFSFPQENVTESIPLSDFQLDFVVVVLPEEGGDENVRRRRKLQQKDVLFQSAQDAELLRLVSDHLFDQFQMNVDGTPISVELGIDTKKEQVMGSGKVMVSYGYVGYAVYSPVSPPITEELDGQVLDAFNTRQGKRALYNSLQYTEDPLLQAIVNVIATSDAKLSTDPSMAVDESSENDLVDDTSGNGSGNSSDPVVALPYVVLITSVLAVTLIVIIGLFTYRKYRKYQENNANNDYVNYQNRKKNKKILDRNAKKLKQYDHFESPEGSVVSQSQDPIYADLEIVGGDTFPMSQDASDVDPSSPLGKQFNPNDTTLPFDEEAQDSKSDAAYDMTYFARSAGQMNVEDQSSSRFVDDTETLEGLYSDKDSYFQESTLASGQHQMAHQRGDSIHSLDTLDNTFGLQNESISHLIEDIDKILENNNQEMSDDEQEGSKEGPVRDEELNQFLNDFVDGVSGEGAGSDNVLETSLTSTADNHRGHIGEIILKDEAAIDESEYDEEEEEDDVGISFDGEKISVDSNDDEDEYEEEDVGISIDGVKSTDEVEEDDVISIDGIIKRRTYTEDAVILEETRDNVLAEDENDSSQEDKPQNTSNTSDVSATDELFARIAELESKIKSTESQLAQDESVHISPPVISPTSSSTAEATQTNDTTSSTIQKGMLSNETLTVIEQTRLSGTPPPSEGEVDNDVIKQAKQHQLLGKYLDGDSDESEEDSVFE